MTVNVNLDNIFDCKGYDRFSNPDQGIFSFNVTINGGWKNVTLVADPIIVTATIDTKFAVGAMLIGSPIDVSVDINITSMGLILEPDKSNFVKWSDIGNLDFTINRTNIAGEMPLDWKGWIYDIRKLNDKVVVYGQNGISFLIPSENTFGLKTIYHLGIKGKQAVVGTDDIHFCIDTSGCLFKLDNKVTRLDFSEYLSKLTNPVMSYDINNQLVYICDGVYGFVYSIDSNSLGEGPVDICGLGNQDSNLYITAPGDVITPVFELCTDIIDFGSRKDKTIHTIEFGTDLTEFLYTSIDVRNDYRSNFMNIGWFPVTPEGIAYINCFGKEFKIRAKVLNYEYLELDYIKIQGNIHRFSPTDS